MGYLHVGGVQRLGNGYCRPGRPGKSIRETSTSGAQYSKLELMYGRSAPVVRSGNSSLFSSESADRWQPLPNRQSTTSTTHWVVLVAVRYFDPATPNYFADFSSGLSARASSTAETSFFDFGPVIER